MPIDGQRFPMYPDHAWGFLYGCDESTVVYWVDEHTFEESPNGTSTPQALEAFEELLDDLRRHVRPRNMAETNDAILAAGWEDRGLLQYNVRSGILLADAVALAKMADEFGNEAADILARHGGRHPEQGSTEWARWVVVTIRRGATVRASRALALAAVEALVNELLAARHPEQYNDWETVRHKGFRFKLNSLLALHDVRRGDLPWYDTLIEHSGLRNSMLHHRPEWVVDHRHDESVAPDDDMTNERLAETLEAVHDSVGELFALYGAPIPETHQPNWAETAADWRCKR